MIAPAAALNRPALRLTPQTVAMLGVAALAWAGVIAYARDMGNGIGTMGMSLGEFVPMWSLMMTAMMLPAVAPVAALYLLTMNSHRAIRGSLFVGGYLFVWAVVGLPAYLALRGVDGRITDGGSTIRVVAVIVLALGGVYQLTPLKAVCLRHCRSPLGQLLRYGNVKGPTRDLKVAVHHAGFCVGCCWALMGLFIAFGIMNVWAMFALAALLISEKLSRHGETIGRVAGASFIVLALCVALSPPIANAVVPSGPPSTSTMTDMGQ